MKGILAAAALTAVLAASVPASAQTADADWDSGVSHYKQQQYRQAISDFQKVADGHPDFANTYFYIGLSHFRLKEFGKSIENNATHGSDAADTAAFELSYFFPGIELTR